MSIAEIANKPISIIKNSTISDAIRMLLNTKISRLVVVDNGRHVGIITEKDIGLFLFSEKTMQGLDDIPISKIMKSIEFVDKGLNHKDSAKIMIEKGISSLAIGENEEVKGIISFRDLFRISIELGSEEDYSGINLSQNIRRGFLSEEGFGNISLARDVMTKGLITVKFNEDLAVSCKILLENNVSGLIVLDGNDGISGIFSKTDVMRALGSI